MKRLLLLMVALLALGGLARASSLTGYACQGWGLTVLAGPYICGTAPPPSGTNDILLVDGTSFILQTDGASKICLAGGC